ncbi:unnamed protein product [Polarella glacialis]|uniref:Uncharacterized protein n=1 Tax=Polarella glacialis TaxID=89957 RepID=A0A813GL59_POLGL|nr:unnamed protein product [Polarella glacialis]
MQTNTSLVLVMPFLQARSYSVTLSHLFNPLSPDTAMWSFKTYAMGQTMKDGAWLLPANERDSSSNYAGPATYIHFVMAQATTNLGTPFFDAARASRGAETLNMLENSKVNAELRVVFTAYPRPVNSGQYLLLYSPPGYEFLAGAHSNLEDMIPHSAETLSLSTPDDLAVWDQTHTPSWLLMVFHLVRQRPFCQRLTEHAQKWAPWTGLQRPSECGRSGLGLDSLPLQLLKLQTQLLQLMLVPSYFTESLELEKLRLVEMQRSFDRYQRHSTVHVTPQAKRFVLCGTASRGGYELLRLSDSAGRLPGTDSEANGVAPRTSVTVTVDISPQAGKLVGHIFSVSGTLAGPAHAATVAWWCDS